jgi:hypothetical protein
VCIGTRRARGLRRGEPERVGAPPWPVRRRGSRQRAARTAVARPRLGISPIKETPHAPETRMRTMITSTSELEDLVDGTVRIPTLPTVLREMQAITSSAEGSAKEAARVIETDPAIATRVLRLVNSSG